MVSKVIVVSKKNIYTLFPDRTVSIKRNTSAVKGLNVYVRTKGDGDSGLWNITEQVRRFFKKNALRYGHGIVFGELLFEIPVKLNLFGELVESTMKLIKDKFDQKNKYLVRTKMVYSSWIGGENSGSLCFWGTDDNGWKERRTNDRKKDVE